LQPTRTLARTYPLALGLRTPNGKALAARILLHWPEVRG
jgi:hypothetical protein